MNALDYGRDNRLRLWFLGVRNFKKYDSRSTSISSFRGLMSRTLERSQRILNEEALIVLVLGEVRRSQSASVPTYKLLQALIRDRNLPLKTLQMVEDQVPDVRRARRQFRGTKREWTIVLQKSRPSYGS